MKPIRHYFKRSKSVPETEVSTETVDAQEELEDMNDEL